MKAPSTDNTGPKIAIRMRVTAGGYILALFGLALTQGTQATPSTYSEVRVNTTGFFGDVEWSEEPGELVEAFGSEFFYGEHPDFPTGIVAGHAKVISDFGRLGVFSELSVSGEPGRVPSLGDPSVEARASFEDTLTVNGPNSAPVTVVGNLILTGMQTGFAFDPFNTWVGIGVSVNGEDIDAVRDSIDSTRYSFAFSAVPGEAFAFGLQLFALANFRWDGGIHYWKADYLNTLTFSSDAPFVLPSGYTLSSLGGTPTVGVATPELSPTVLLLGISVGLLLAAKRNDSISIG